MTYAVDLSKLRAACGSGDESLLDRSRKWAEDEDVQLALTELVHTGADPDGDDGSDIGFALSCLCQALGEPLSNTNWSAMRFEWFDTVDAALKGCGSKLRLQDLILSSGSPVPLPWIDDFPMIGHIPPSKLSRLRNDVEAALAGTPGAKKRRFLAAEVAESVVEFCHWLVAAEKQPGTGLVFFYY